MVCGHCLVTLSLTINETLKCLSSLPVLMQESFWWGQCSDRYIIFPHTPYPSFSSSLSLMVSVDVKQHCTGIVEPVGRRVCDCEGGIFMSGLSVSRCRGSQTPLTQSITAQTVLIALAPLERSINYRAKCDNSIQLRRKK